MRKRDPQLMHVVQLARERDEAIAALEELDAVLDFSMHVDPGDFFITETTAVNRAFDTAYSVLRMEEARRRIAE